MLFKIIASLSAMAIPIIIGVFRYRSISPAFRVLLFFLVITFLFQAGGFAGAIWFNQNLQIYHGLSLISIPLYYLILRRLNQHTAAWKYIQWFFPVIFSLAIINTVFIARWENFPVFNINLLQLLLILCALIYYNTLLDTPTEEPLHRNSVFWFYSCVFVYSICTIFIWATMDYLLSAGIRTQKVNLIYFIISLIFYPSLVIGLVLDNGAHRRAG